MLLPPANGWCPETSYPRRILVVVWLLCFCRQRTVAQRRVLYPRRILVVSSSYPRLIVVLLPPTAVEELVPTQKCISVMCHFRFLNYIWTSRNVIAVKVISFHFKQNPDCKIPTSLEARGPTKSDLSADTLIYPGTIIHVGFNMNSYVKWWIICARWTRGNSSGTAGRHAIHRNWRLQLGIA